MTDTTSLTGRLTRNEPQPQEIPTTLDQLPSFPELLLEQARQHVAEGSLPLATARHYFPDVTDWPEPPSDDEPELTSHQRELVRHLGLSVTDGAAFSYGYLQTFVKIALQSGDLGQLRRHYNDLTVAREYVAAKR